MKSIDKFEKCLQHSEINSGNKPDILHQIGLTASLHKVHILPMNANKSLRWDKVQDLSTLCTACTAIWVSNLDPLTGRLGAARDILSELSASNPEHNVVELVQNAIISQKSSLLPISLCIQQQCCMLLCPYSSPCCQILHWHAKGCTPCSKLVSSREPPQRYVDSQDWSRSGNFILWSLVQCH